MDRKHAKRESEQNKTGFVSVLTTAIKSKDVEVIMNAIKQVDARLTEQVMQGENEASTKSTIVEFLNDLSSSGDADAIIYLSDGGVSRLNVWWNENDEILINLTESSKEAVKLKWEAGK